MRSDPDLIKLGPVKALRRAYMDVTGEKLDKYGRPSAPVTDDTGKKDLEGGIKSEGGKDAKPGKWSAEGVGAMTNEEYQNAEKSGALKENWDAIVGVNK